MNDAMANALLDKLRRDEVALGLGLMYGSPNCVECIAQGWDWLWIDGQHGQYDYTCIIHTVQVAELTGLSTVVRVPGHEAGAIALAADTGADGVMAPMVDTADEARAVVSASRFPPLGRRSFGGRRPIDKLGREYYADANQDLMVIVQVETVRAVENARETAAVHGVDALFFGPDDMKVAMGLPINTPIHESSALTEAMRRTARAARDAGKVAGCVAGTAELIKLAVSLGYRLIAGACDVPLLRQGAEARNAELRQALAGTSAQP